MTTPGDPVTAGPLQRIAALGGYFAMPVLPDPAAGDPGRRWRGFRELLEPAVAHRFVSATRSAIAASTGCADARIDLRLAASSFHLGVAARLLSPVIGSTTCLSEVPLIGAETLLWRADGHSAELAVTGVDHEPALSLEHAAGVIGATILSTFFEPLHETLAAIFSLSPRVSRGNVISAANGAVTVLAMSQPRFEARGRTLVRALLDTPALAGSGEFRDGQFVRNSCCLFYRAPGAGLCGDCVLALSPASHRRS